MATFITTIKFTEKGIQGIQESLKRAAAFKAAAKKMGVKVTDIYWTLGYFDGVVIFDAPDDESATAAMRRVRTSPTTTHSSMRRLRSIRFCLQSGRVLQVVDLSKANEVRTGLLEGVEFRPL